MRAIDFFCGAGGLTRGLLNVGIEVVAGFDANPRCKETYERNNRPARFYEQDICDVSTPAIWKLLGSRRTSDLLIAGCAPCQPFSKQRKRSSSVCKVTGAVADPDATLLGAFARLVEELQPGQVLIENVPGIAKVKGLSTYRRFLRMLRSNSYHIAEGVLDAKHYGVPQTRRRYVVIAIRNREASLPDRQFGQGLGSVSTVRTAIEHFPPIVAGESHSLIPNHVAAVISEKNLARIRSTPHNGGDRRSWPPELELDCHKGDYEGHTDVYGRMNWDQPAPTLTGRCNSLSNGRYGHPSQDRAISLREAASLQSFPDSYIFHGLNQQIARQIGNAVPVRFAEALGRHLRFIRNPESAD
jgi:DNA (cytosine-5)-methyltransferase 1